MNRIQELSCRIARQEMTAAEPAQRRRLQRDLYAPATRREDHASVKPSRNSATLAPSDPTA